MDQLVHNLRFAATARKGLVEEGGECNLRQKAPQKEVVSRGTFHLDLWAERVGLKTIGFGGKHEVSLAQAADAVGPQSDLDSSPG
jgi:hypothetical protein